MIMCRIEKSSAIYRFISILFVISWGVAPTGEVQDLNGYCLLPSLVWSPCSLPSDLRLNFPYWELVFLFSS